jgi:hypothetical protein
MITERSEKGFYHWLEYTVQSIYKPDLNDIETIHQKFITDERERLSSPSG